MIFKNSLRKIKKSLGRFLSLIFIVMLGSAFFSGIREAATDMIKTMDEYYDETSLMDYKIISTMGLTTGDVESIKEISSDLIVVPSYSFDILLDGDVTRIHAITEVNKVNLVSGSMPSDNECLVEDGTYNIGDKIVIESDNLKVKEYTVSGTVTSSLYTYKSKGISNIGDGKLDTFIYIPIDNFDIEYYTEIYIIDKNSVDKTSYLDDYKEVINILENKLKELKPIRETIRYEEILKEAMDIINEAEEKLLNEKETNGKKLEDALKELDENKQKIEDGYDELDNGKKELDKTNKEMERTFNDANSKLESAKKEYNNALKKYNLKESELESNLNLLTEQISNLNNLLNSLDPSSEEYLTYSAQLKILEENKTNLELLINTKEELIKQEEELNKNIDLWNTEFAKQASIINEKYDELDEASKEVEDG